MIQHPPYLKKGDKIAIICPAKKLNKPITAAITLFEQWGLQVICGKSVQAEYHQFAGDDNFRAADIQSFLDDQEIKAVIAARGGYGTIRIIDKLDFTAFLKNPKWIVGFSDITLLLSHLLAAFDIQSIHGQMPVVFAAATPPSLESLRQALFGETISYTYTSLVPNRPGQAEGIVIGGNLTLLVMAEGSTSAVDYNGKILFLEDVGEHEYAIDRMMRMLKRSGKLAGLKGLVVGAFTGLEKEEIPFGQTIEEIVMDVIQEYDYPVCFNFPTGHIPDNRAMVIGKTLNLSVGHTSSTLTFN